MPDVPQLLPLLAVAKALCVSPHTVRAWVRQGRLNPCDCAADCFSTRMRLCDSWRT